MNNKENIGSCALLAFGIAMIGGCASTAEISAETGAIVESQWRQLEASETCCSEFQSGDFIPITGEGGELRLDPGKARTFDAGKSYFKGIQLAALKGSPLLVVKSHQSLPRRNGLPYLIRPSYILVDENLQGISSVVDMPLCYAQGWGKRETGYFGIVKIDPASAWGLLFHTATSSRGTYVKYGNEATTVGGGAVVDITVNYSFPVAPTGVLEVLPLTEEMRSHLEKKCPQLFR